MFKFFTVRMPAASPDAGSGQGQAAGQQGQQGGQQQQQQGDGQQGGGQQGGGQQGQQQQQQQQGEQGQQGQQGGGQQGGGQQQQQQGQQQQGQQQQQQQQGQQQAPDYSKLTLPTDNRHVDASDLDAFREIAKSKGWTAEQAQSELNTHAKAMADQSAAFRTELQAHAEIGGDKLAVAQQRANAVLDKFLPAESPEGKLLRSGFNKGGYDNWTPIVLLLSRIGAAMSEDQLRIAAGAAQQGSQNERKPTPDVLFPSTAGFKGGASA